MMIKNSLGKTGYTGQFKQNLYTAAAISITSNTYFSIDSGNVSFNDGNEVGIILEAGTIWDIQAVGYFNGDSGCTATDHVLFIGTAKGNLSTGQLLEQNVSRLCLSSSAPTRICLSTPIWRVNVGVQTTFYAKGLSVFSGGTMKYLGSIRATRISP